MEELRGEKERGWRTERRGEKTGEIDEDGGSKEGVERGGGGLEVESLGMKEESV